MFLTSIKRKIRSNALFFKTFKAVLLYVRFLKSLSEEDQYKKLKKIKYTDSFEIHEKGYHCYFGYYDKSPINQTSKYIIYLRVKDKHNNDLPVDICLYDIDSKKISKIGETVTWNWQQGCMLQWLTTNTISFNSYNPKHKNYECKIIDVNEPTNIKTINRAVYSYNRDHSKYLSLNFNRLDLFAKGYGYPFAVDDMDYSKDGIWEVDVRTNTNKLILTLETIINFNPKNYNNMQHYVNHVAYTVDENSIIFIHRWQMKGGEFKSRLLIYNLHNKTLDTLLDNGHVSHYCWKDDRTLFIYATDANLQKGYMEVDIKNKKTKMIKGLPLEDGHPSYSNDRKIILTDTYPNHRRFQYLFCYDVDNKKLNVLDKLWSPFRYFNEQRCDLHPRWSNDNNFICVDNTNTGYRGIKVYKLK